MPSSPAAVGPGQPGGEHPGVTPLELFFDLVFVFTITQLTQLLVHHLTLARLWQVSVMLALIFWMYDGYAWLTNAVVERDKRVEQLLLAGMACYLVLAIVIPHAFARRSDAVTFGVAYLLINLIHAFLYVTAAGGSSAEAMRQLAPWNLGTATAVIVGGLLGGLAQELIWTAIPVLQWFLLGARTGGGWELRPGYFVERHGQLILIAIGESVVATGVGASARLGVSLTLVLMVTLGLLVSAALWWTYFGEGDEQLERELAARDPRGRVQVAIRGFGYSHYAMLLAVVVISAGIRQAVEFPHLGMNPAHAFALAGGAALFIAADGWFRVTLGLRRIGRRELGALSLLLAVPLAVYLAAWVGLAATAVLIMAAITSERRQLATGREQV